VTHTGARRVRCHAAPRAPRRGAVARGRASALQSSSPQELDESLDESQPSPNESLDESLDESQPEPPDASEETWRGR